VLLGCRDAFAAVQFGFDERASTLLIEPYDEALRPEITLQHRRTTAGAVLV
jgi:hypothetical protein